VRSERDQEHVVAGDPARARPSARRRQRRRVRSSTLARRFPSAAAPPTLTGDRAQRVRHPEAFVCFSVRRQRGLRL